MKSEVNDSDKSEKQLLDIRDVIHNPSQINEDEWSQFVSENDYGNIFQTPEMYRVFLDTEHYEPVFTALLDENDEIMATMLGALIEEPGRITRRFSRRIVVYGGPLISEKGDRDHLLKTILEAHNDYVKRRAIFTEIRNLAPITSLKPVFESTKYKYVDHLDIHMDLTIGVEKLWKRLHRSRKKGIRRAIKSGLRCIDLTLENLDDLYSIVQNMYERISIPMPPKSLFESVMTILQEKGLARTIGVELNEELVGVGVVLLYKDIVYAWYGSDNRQYSNLDINAYRIWSTIKWGVASGFNLFDFGGAGQRTRKYGVREFKLSMGGYEVELGRLICTHNLVKSFITSAGFKVWRATQLAKQFNARTK